MNDSKRLHDNDGWLDDVYDDVYNGAGVENVNERDHDDDLTTTDDRVNTSAGNDMSAGNGIGLKDFCRELTMILIVLVALLVDEANVCMHFWRQVKCMKDNDMCICNCDDSIENDKLEEYREYAVEKWYMVNDEILEQGRVSEFKFCVAQPSHTLEKVWKGLHRMWVWKGLHRMCEQRCELAKLTTSSFTSSSSGTL